MEPVLFTVFFRETPGEEIVKKAGSPNLIYLFDDSISFFRSPDCFCADLRSLNIMNDTGTSCFTPTPMDPGTGLGHIAADVLVRAHGGFIALQSTAGTGAVYLPVEVVSA